MQSEQLTRNMVNALEELKAADIKVLDVRSATDVTDFMIVASGRSKRQVMALADIVERRAKEHGEKPMGTEGEKHGEWILVDLCDVVVHIMLPEIREFYQLEKLWSDLGPSTRVFPARILTH
jgi:ribosome-associated protein